MTLPISDRILVFMAVNPTVEFTSAELRRKFGIRDGQSVVAYFRKHLRNGAIEHIVVGRTHIWRAGPALRQEIES